MSSQGANYLERKLCWRRTSDPLYPYDAEFDGKRCVLRVNDFPEEDLYTLFVDHIEVESFNEWPEQWTRFNRTPQSRKSWDTV